MEWNMTFNFIYSLSRVEHSLNYEADANGPVTFN